jgi:hypothetical protein
LGREIGGEAAAVGGFEESIKSAVIFLITAFLFQYFKNRCSIALWIINSLQHCLNHCLPASGWMYFGYWLKMRRWAWLLAKSPQVCHCRLLTCHSI